MGQRPDSSDIADRPQALTGPQARIDQNPTRAGFNADGLQAKPFGARTAPWLADFERELLSFPGGSLRRSSRRSAPFPGLVFPHDPARVTLVDPIVVYGQPFDPFAHPGYQVRTK
jgi:hypothetical protein